MLTCTTNNIALIWRIELFDDKGRSFVSAWFLSSRDATHQEQQLFINHTTFTSTRTSAQYSSLVTTLTITNVTNALNMTQINCTEIIGNMPATAPSTIAIHIISSTSE